MLGAAPPPHRASPACLPLPQDRIVRAAYADFRGEIHSGDMLLWNPTSLVGRLIGRETRSAISHVSMAGWWSGHLLEIGMVLWNGCDVNALSHQVRRWPGTCHVYRPRDPYNGWGAVAAMVGLIKQPYGWQRLLRIWARRHLPSLLPAPQNCDQPERQGVCSTSTAWASRVGGQRIVCPDKPDLETTPADHADPGYARYLATLYP
jgi:hypothetical protein